MKKLYLFFLFLITFMPLRAQLDTEHWFAPMGSNFPGGANTFQQIYLSTGDITPFKVQIFNNNTLIGTETISKDNPTVFNIANRDLIITEDDSQKLRVTSRGLHLKGPKKFFANLRFSVVNHAEIVTSKGAAGLGKTFFAAMPKMVEKGNFNYTIGIIATEDNTVVKLSGYDSNVIFVDDSTDDEKTVTLNQGESYILEANNNDGNNEFTKGLIGTKITSDKPISVSNGNFSGRINPGYGIDIFMDQSVPVERLGTAHVVMSGNGNIPSIMEEVLVVATKDNTLIFVNDETTPIATLNEGEFYFIPSSKYFLANAQNGVQNIYIRSTQEIYTYQVLAGNRDPEFEAATGGFNFIPQINCFLPNSIDQLGKIDENPGYVSSRLITNHTTKLNIIAESGARVVVNGSEINGPYGPYPISGTNLWETFSMPNVTGNLSISTLNGKAITAGIAAGSSAIGYGGYFAGFSSVPVISKGGTCDTGITLEVDNTYSSYQWFKDGVQYTGAGANTYILHNPPKGIYTVEINKTGCGSKTTPPHTLQSCADKTTKTFTIGTCNPIIEILPKLTNSSQLLDASTVKIDIAPSKGTAVIDPNTGKISYTLSDTNNSGTDTFTYYFFGTDPTLPDSEIVTVTINYKKITTKTGQAFSCIDVTNKGTFDLTTAQVSVDDNIISVEYFENYDAAAGTFSAPITNKTSYYSPEKSVYAKVTNEFNCTSMAEVELRFYPIPNINTVDFDSKICDLNLDGKYEVNFTEVSKQIVEDYSKFDIYYYSDAAYTNQLPNIWTFTNPTRVYVKVASRNGCVDATGFIDFEGLQSLNATDYSAIVCDNDLSGSENVSLSNFNTFLNAPGGSSFQYYVTEDNAKNNVSAISSNQIISATTDYYVRIENATACPNVKKLTITFSQPNTSSELTDKVVCSNTTTVLDAGTGFSSYIWSTGETTQSIVAGKGSYWVDLQTGTCVYRQHVNITEAEEPVITSVIVDGNTLTINAEGGIQPLEYSVDGINFQSSNVITNVNRGLGKVYVRSAKLRCKAIEKEFLIINLVNAITPNGDGINDALDYSDLRIKNDVKIVIFDRYGNTIFTNSDSLLTWDGKINGRNVNSGTYWYTLQWTEPDTQLKMALKGWVLVKNRN